MAKEVKLNLDLPDLSKAKLTLEEEGNSVEMDPKLKLNSEPIGLAEKLVLDLEKAYENPAIKAYIKAEEDRRALIQASIERWNEPSLQTKMREYEELLKSPAYAMALESSDSIQGNIAKTIEAISGKNYEDAKKALEDFNPKMNAAYAVAQSAMEQFRKTIENPSVQNSISQLENFGIYESGLAKAAASIANNEDMIKAAQSLNEIGKSIVNDSFQHRMNEHGAANFRRNFTAIPPSSKNHLLEHNKQIIDQNDQLIETSKLQNDILNDMAEYMRLQNSYTDQSVKELERQNQQIEDQIEQKEYEIEANSEATKYTLWVAMASIVISIVVSGISIWATYDVYRSEDIAGNKDQIELLKAIKESSNTINLAKELQYQKDVNTIQQQQMTQLNQEVEQLKIYLNGKRQ